MTDTQLDCTGLACPMPIVKMTKAAKTMAAGETLSVTADDPGFEPDVQAWTEARGHDLVSLTEADGLFTAIIRIA